MAVEGEEWHVHASRILREGLDAAALERTRLRLRTDDTLAEGHFVIVRDGGGIEIRGLFSGVIYGAQALVERCGRGLDLNALGFTLASDSPGLPYRTVWTWDHSTNWDLSEIVHQKIGVFHPYRIPLFRTLPSERLLS